MKPTFLGVFLLVFSSCSNSTIQKWNQQLKQEWNALIMVIQGESSPLVKGPSARVSPTEKSAKVNAEILQEMYKTVWITTSIDRSQFGNWVDSLNQGASFEGVFNGFVHSVEYKNLEERNVNAHPELVKLFAEHWSWLLLEMDQPTKLKPQMVLPLSRPDLGAMEKDAASGSSTGLPIRPRKSKDDETWRLNIRSDIEALFTKASPFTLKRVLGSEAIHLLNEKQKDKKQLLDWYGRFCERMAKSQVDFGVKERNLADRAFHEKWASEVSEGVIAWEVLNRLQRVLNEQWKRVDPNGYPLGNRALPGN